MKNIVLLTIISLCYILCSENFSTAEMNTSAFSVLTKVTTPDQIYQQFEYNSSGHLVKESVFLASCEVPTSIYSYSYSDQQLKKVNTLDRGLYSSTSTMCDPSSGMKSELSFEYDAKSRIAKVIYPASYTELEYNSQNQISKLSVAENGKILYYTTFTYDAAGNIRTETDQDGNTVEYSYDDKINPYFLIKQRPHFISPFNTSPNNVIEASGARTFKRSFHYNSQGLPTEVQEDNLITYTFHYN